MQGAEAGEVALAALDRHLIAFLAAATAGDLASGHTEMAVARLQAALEYNCFAPPIFSGHPLQTPTNTAPRDALELLAVSNRAWKSKPSGSVNQQTDDREHLGGPEGIHHLCENLLTCSNQWSAYEQFDGPAGTDAEKLEVFRRFWEGGEPLVGEPGARGWVHSEGPSLLTANARGDYKLVSNLHHKICSLMIVIAGFLCGHYLVLVIIFTKSKTQFQKNKLMEQRLRLSICHSCYNSPSM